MLTQFQYWILRKIAPGEPRNPDQAAYPKKLKLESQLGTEFLDRIGGKTVIDFGCGEGQEAVELARRGAGEVIGIDIREEILETARRNARAGGVVERCSFAASTSRLADFVISLDAFEHFADPADVLRVMDTLLKPEGEVIIWFGPTWFHPHGWAHVLFREEALIRWRSTFKSDGATPFQRSGRRAEPDDHPEIREDCGREPVSI